MRAHLTTKEKTQPTSEQEVELLLCQQCGGNGYTKSSPNCYQTCLECLGRGLILPNQAA